MKWTGLVQNMLAWRTSEIIATKVEEEMYGGPVSIRTHESVREKKKKSLLKHMHALRSLITPFDPDDHIYEDEEGLGEEDQAPVKRNGVEFVPESERVNRLCDSMFQGPKNEVDMRTAEEKRRDALAKQNQRDE
jgi:hypothetical protein